LKPSRKLLAHLLLLAVVIIWGATFSLTKGALADTTPLVFVGLRMAIAFLVLAAVNLRSLRGLTRTDVAFGTAAGVFLALGTQLQTAGLETTTAAKAAFITGLIVVIVPLASAIPGVAPANSPRPTLDTYVGAVLAFAGLALLTVPAGSTNPGHITEFFAELFSGFGRGELLCLACALAYTAHLLTLSRAPPRTSARRLGTLQVGSAALLVLLLLSVGCARGDRPPFHPTPGFWLALGMTAVLGTAVAFTVQSWAQQHMPASNAALIIALEPVFAWLIALLFFGEHLGGRALAGAALILAGILIAELRPTSRPHAPLQLPEPVVPNTHP
jgi:drug/metabolite transporter (DMT)-like permease